MAIISFLSDRRTAGECNVLDSFPVQEVPERFGGRPLVAKYQDLGLAATGLPRMRFFCPNLADALLDIDPSIRPAPGDVFGC